jgi:GNAT superfamily N-acetyltransferase
MADIAAAEAVEQAGFVAWFEAASRLASKDFDWSMQPVGDALCSVSSTEPSILVNRVLGLGLRSAPDHDELLRIRKLYAAAGITRFFLHVIPELLGPDGAALLEAAGYRKYRGWMKFTRGAGDIGPVDTDLSIRRIGPGHGMDFATIAGNAFDLAPAFRPAVAALADAPGWHLYMSFHGQTPAGTGAFYLGDRIATVDFGATHPDFRRRGSQTGLLNTRIREALGAGADAVMTMTGEAVPGDAQQSYRNIEKAGFAACYLRENWIPAGD